MCTICRSTIKDQPSRSLHRGLSTPLPHGSSSAVVWSPSHTVAMCVLITCFTSLQRPKSKKKGKCHVAHALSSPDRDPAEFEIGQTRAEKSKKQKYEVLPT